MNEAYRDKIELDESGGYLLLFTPDGIPYRGDEAKAKPLYDSRDLLVIAYEDLERKFELVAKFLDGRDLKLAKEININRYLALQKAIHKSLEESNSLWIALSEIG